MPADLTHRLRSAAFLNPKHWKAGKSFYHGSGPSNTAAPSPSQQKNQYQRKTMPTYHVEMMEGRTIDQKKKLVEAITRVSVEILGGVPDSVDIIITDIKRENWSTGGKLWSEPRD